MEKSRCRGLDLADLYLVDYIVRLLLKRRRVIEKGIVIFTTIPFCRSFIRMPIVDASVEDIVILFQERGDMFI